MPRSVALALSASRVFGPSLRPRDEVQSLRRWQSVRAKAGVYRDLYDLHMQTGPWVDEKAKELRRKARMYWREQDRLLRHIQGARDFCKRRQSRREVMFALRVAGIGGPRWARMMKGARHGVESGYTCRR